MAFTKSTVATNNISNLANQPVESATTLKQKFDQYGIDDKVRFNALIDELEATTGASGAENIGSKTISGVAGNTPHAQIADLKEQLDERDGENVKLTGDQTVSGVKTFNSSPIVPTPSSGTQAANKDYADTKTPLNGDHLGTWQGYSPTLVDPGLSSVVESHTAKFEEAKYIINVMGEGVKGDNSTDDTENIITAITKASLYKSSGYKTALIFPPCKGYMTTAPIVIPTDIDVLMDSPIIYYGESNSTILTVGEAGVNNFKVRLKLNVKRNTQATWLSEDDKGIKLYNCNSSIIDIVASENNTIGVQAIGDGAGFAYNTVFMGYIVNNKYGLDVTNDNSLGTLQGWCNENTFIGGRYACVTGVNPGESRYGIRINSINFALYNDNNVFEKPAIELGKTTASPGVATLFLIRWGSSNKFKDVRSESNSDVLVEIYNRSEYNEIELGYSEFDFITADPIKGNAVNDQSTSPFNTVTVRSKNPLKGVTFPIFNSGPIYKTAVQATSDTKTVYIPGMSAINPSESIVRPYYYYTTINPSWIEVTNNVGIGLFVNTKNLKKFVVRRDVEFDKPGRVFILCFDADGKRLTNTDPGHPYLKSTYNRPLNYTTNYGGGYINTFDNQDDVLFAVSDDVKSVYVGVSSGTNPIRIRALSIHALNCNLPTTSLFAASWSGTEEGIPNAPLSNTINILGTFNKSKIILNSNPTSGGYIGWVCTQGGTNGTLTGVTGNATSSTPYWALSAITGLNIGDYITMVGVSGVKKIVYINVITGVVTLDSNSDATVTGGAVTLSPAVFKQWGLIS